MVLFNQICNMHLLHHHVPHRTQSNGKVIVKKLKHRNTYKWKLPFPKLPCLSNEYHSALSFLYDSVNRNFLLVQICDGLHMISNTGGAQNHLIWSWKCLLFDCSGCHCQSTELNPAPFAVGILVISEIKRNPSQPSNYWNKNWVSDIWRNRFDFSNLIVLYNKHDASWLILFFTKISK